MSREYSCTLSSCALHSLPVKIARRNMSSKSEIFFRGAPPRTPHFQNYHPKKTRLQIYLAPLTADLAVSLIAWTCVAAAPLLVSRSTYTALLVHSTKAKVTQDDRSRGTDQSRTPSSS